MMHKTSYQAFVFGAVMTAILAAVMHRTADTPSPVVQQLPTVVIEGKSQAKPVALAKQLPKVVVVGKRASAQGQA